jgi:hypothetical protein
VALVFVEVILAIYRNLPLFRELLSLLRAHEKLLALFGTNPKLALGK